MSRLSWIFYISVLTIFAALTMFALWLGLWWYAVLAIVFGVAFVYAGWYVLAKAWKPPLQQDRRPVRRRW
jgi:heme O synthase-like polyprenyltransferase